MNNLRIVVTIPCFNEELSIGKVIKDFRKALPEAEIIVFDNGSSPYKDLAHVGCSFVLEINPVTKEEVWVYDDREFFHSNFTSAVQRLRNGNTLITEAWHGRIFEVTPERETVWEYVAPQGRALASGYRPAT